MMKKSIDKRIGKKLWLLITVGMSLAIIFAGCSRQNSGSTDAAPTAVPDAKDLHITAAELSEQARFYSVDTDGNEMEVIALVASDGSTRIAFNTCQVCYSSGRGYYKIDGDELVCQNCGNRFSGDAVGIENGGCNPIPITEEDRAEQDGVITISGEYLDAANQVFQNWKQ